jgi:phosphonate C-P lyase system protein PhnG
VSRLARLVRESCSVEITCPPTQGLLLATVEDSVEGNAFYPGEILVTTCEARVNQRLGYAVTLGDDPDKARGCAVLDACLQDSFPERLAILEVLAEERRWLQTRRHAECEMVQSTRVQFETMDPQR